jgi:parallel beta-helix repeat protein
VNNQVFVASFLIPGIFSIIILALYPSISEIQSLYGSNAKYSGIIAANTNDIHNLHQDINHNNTNYAKNNECISYDASEKSIIISCGSAHLTDIANQINGQNVTDGSVAYGIHVYGSLIIDFIRLTSWNPDTNNYAQSYGSRETSGKITHPGAPRPYIRIESGSTGTTNITNSEIAYLGYEGGWASGTSGIHYHNGGDASIIKNNKIHNLYFGFYSNSVSGITIENNLFYNNGHYGIDPHTGTHDMIIRNNTVYGNNGTAIICSLDCYNILIENNKVYNNTGSGITFSRNMTNSVVRNNLVHDQKNAIFVSKSHNNQVYNNTISNTDDGISLANGASNNKVHDNRIINSVNALRFNADSHENTLYSNKIINNATLHNR